MNMNTSFNLIWKLQNNFNLNICQEIFGKNYNHFWLKWISSQNNIVCFINSLDDHNKQKVFNFLLKK
jgi:hypothetical protein